MMNGKCCPQSDPVSGRGGTSGPMTSAPIEEVSSQKHEEYRRKCGCLRTSDKVKQVLGTFPAPPPPTPVNISMFDKACGYAYGRGAGESKLPSMPCTPHSLSGCCKDALDEGKSWKIVSDLVTVVQLSVTATALALYYLIYCYMQIVYYTLKSAMYFHNADGPMKVTIGVVTATTLLIAFNMLMRMEGLLSIVY